MHEQLYVVGIDEVGRGSLAGPAVVGAVAIPIAEESTLVTALEDLLKRTLTDSKHLTRLQREKAAAYLSTAVTWGIGEVEAEEIDQLGLTAALRLASGRALAALTIPLNCITLIDADAGLRHPHEAHISTKHHIKGDERFAHISAASILAKTHRDSLMRDLSQKYPAYGWDTNVGYGTITHRRAIEAHGLSPAHRRSFVVKPLVFVNDVEPLNR